MLVLTQHDLARLNELLGEVRYKDASKIFDVLNAAAVRMAEASKKAAAEAPAAVEDTANAGA